MSAVIANNSFAFDTRAEFHGVTVGAYNRMRHYFQLLSGFTQLLKTKYVILINKIKKHLTCTKRMQKIVLKYITK
jgi:hypothetical protein